MESYGCAGRRGPGVAARGPPGLTNGDEGADDKIEWHWPGRIMKGEVNLIDGRKGQGKSTMMCDFAVRITSGKPFPGQRKSSLPGACLWFGSEENFNKAIKPRFVALGGNPKSIFTVDPSKLDGSERIYLPGAVDLLEAHIRYTGCKILVVDPFTALANPLADFNNPSFARMYMETLRDLCHAHRMTILVNRHFRKSTVGCAIEHGLGSIQIVNVCRVVLRVDEHPQDRDVKILSTVATNYGEIPPPVSFHLEKATASLARVEWGKVLDLTMDEIMQPDEDAGGRDERTDATTLLIGILKSGKKTFEVIEKECKRAGVSLRTIRTAKAKLKIKSQRVSKGNGGDGFYYWLPPISPPG